MYWETCEFIFFGPTIKVKVIVWWKNSGKAWLRFVKLMTAAWVHFYEGKRVRIMDTICFYSQIWRFIPFLLYFTNAKKYHDMYRIMSIVSRYVSDRLRAVSAITRHKLSSTSTMYLCRLFYSTIHSCYSSNTMPGYTPPNHYTDLTLGRGTHAVREFSVILAAPYKNPLVCTQNNLTFDLETPGGSGLE
jgi:hypothetical protein